MKNIEEVPTLLDRVPSFFFRATHCNDVGCQPDMNQIIVDSETLMRPEKMPEVRKNSPETAKYLSF